MVHSALTMRHFLGWFSPALAAGLLLAGCRGGAVTPESPPTPAPTPTPWPTLSALAAPTTTREAEDLAEAVAVESTTSPNTLTVPELVDQYRVDVEPGITAVFPLEGRIDYPVRIEVIVLAGDVDAVIDVRSPAGDQLVSANSAGTGEPEVIGQFQFPGDGFYELGIASIDGLGEVGVSVYHMPSAALDGGGEFIAVPQELGGAIRQPSSYHTFRLPLNRGARVDIEAEALTPGLDLLFRLYGPDGNLLAARDDNIAKNPVLWNFMPDQDGVYTLVLSNYDENTGDYALRVTPSQGDGEAVIGSRTSIDLQGSPRRSTWLTFTGTALNAVRVEARPLDDGIDIWLAIYDKYGNLLTTVDTFGIGEPEQLTTVQLPFTGSYQVEFLTYGEGGAIEYLIRPETLADLEQGGMLAAGGPGQEAEIVGPGTVLSWAFEAQAGQLIGLDAHGTGGTGLDLGFSLYSPDGYLLLTRDDVVGLDPVLDRFEVPASGRYVLCVWNNGRSSGPFDVFVTSPEGAATPPSP